MATRPARRCRSPTPVRTASSRRSYNLSKQHESARTAATRASAVTLSRRRRRRRRAVHVPPRAWSRCATPTAPRRTGRPASSPCASPRRPGQLDTSGVDRVGGQGHAARALPGFQKDFISKYMDPTEIYNSDGRADDAVTRTQQGHQPPREDERLRPSGDGDDGRGRRRGNGTPRRPTPPRGAVYLMSKARGRPRRQQPHGPVRGSGRGHRSTPRCRSR